MVYFTGCTHLGHRRISSFRDVSSTEENTERIVSDWKQMVHKRGVVYVLGDAAFTDEANDLIKTLPGRKILVKGNHDDLVSTRRQMDVYEEIYGLFKYKKMWLSHAPIHPDELREKPNVHAHVHSATVDDPRYLNCCVDELWRTTGKSLISLDDVKKHFAELNAPPVERERPLYVKLGNTALRRLGSDRYYRDAGAWYVLDYFDEEGVHRVVKHMGDEEGALAHVANQELVKITWEEYEEDNGKWTRQESSDEEDSEFFEQDDDDIPF